MHCRRYTPPPISRRDMLLRCASGFGAVALSALLNDRAFASPPAGHSPLSSAASPKAPGVATHCPPRARNVIFLYMDGGPSQVDTFDPKPLLAKEHGQPFKMKKEPTQFNQNGNTLASPWKFRQYGRSGRWVSDLSPHVATCADDLAVVRSMTSNFSEHTQANYFLHTGSGMQGRPSMGAWGTYGRGSESQNLPAFVALNGGVTPPGGGR